MAQSVTISEANTIPAVYWPGIGIPLQAQLLSATCAGILLAGSGWNP